MLEEAIVTFLKKHHLLTLATSQENVPYCASCFYALDEQNGSFIHATDEKTRHGREALENVHVAGVVALETKIPPPNRLGGDCHRKNQLQMNIGVEHLGTHAHG